MPAKDVKVYVKRNKNDAADAEAICEAAAATDPGDQCVAAPVGGTLPTNRREGAQREIWGGTEPCA
jgi:hypothetical protein